MSHWLRLLWLFSFGVNMWIAMVQMDLDMPLLSFFSAAVAGFALWMLIAERG